MYIIEQFHLSYFSTKLYKVLEKNHRLKFFIHLIYKPFLSFFIFLLGEGGETLGVLKT